MIVKNWMAKNPDTISSDLTASEALNIFDKKRVPFMPVVDNGIFRGLLARRDLREAAAWAISTQDIREMEYFNTMLKVRDIMVRRPVTLRSDDTVVTALEKGKRFGRSFLPVMEDDQLVGYLSDRDLNSALSQILGGDEELHSVSIEINGDPKVTIESILDDLFRTGIKIKGLLTLKATDSDFRRLIIKFEAKCVKRITALIDKRGYKMLEFVDKEQLSH